MKKPLKVALATVASVATLAYGGVFLGHKVFFPMQTSNVATIESARNDQFVLGTDAHETQAQTLEEYIPILAQQIRHYNETAPEIWPDNAITNQSAVVEGLESGKFYFISPDGEAKPLTTDEALAFGFQRANYVNGFSQYDGGMYITVSESDLPNFLEWQKYLHLGTYDALLSLSHEGFHMKEQPKWAGDGSDVENRERNDYLENTAARAKRDLLQKQLLQAVSEPGNTALILDALATYEDWKVQFPEDYKAAKEYDRMEGTAQYYEIVSSLYAAYPDQVNSENIDDAIALLATRPDIYVLHGVSSEAYMVGGFAGFLLDRLEDDWKERLMADPQATPIEMLSQHFENETLPPAHQLTQSEIDEVGEAINAARAGHENDGLPRAFQMLYDILY